MKLEKLESYGQRGGRASAYSASLRRLALLYIVLFYCAAYCTGSAGDGFGRTLARARRGRYVFAAGRETERESWIYFRTLRDLYHYVVSSMACARHRVWWRDGRKKKPIVPSSVRRRRDFVRHLGARSANSAAAPRIDFQLAAQQITVVRILRLLFPTIVLSSFLFTLVHARARVQTPRYVSFDFDHGRDTILRHDAGHSISATRLSTVPRTRRLEIPSRVSVRAEQRPSRINNVFGMSTVVRFACRPRADRSSDSLYTSYA